jgi:threonine dehydrogenase-like Zn-dependent dehydrogenase
MLAHVSQCIRIPDEVSDDAAVLADPFAVGLHAILHNPPAEGETALVYSCGTLGLLAIAILRHLHPSVKIIAIARYPHPASLASEMGAHQVLAHEPAESVIEAISSLTEAEPNVPSRGLPMLNGGRGEIPKRFEWTPLYFKALARVGSNAFGFESHAGRRKHAMAWFFEFILNDALDVTAILTHRFALADYRDAFMHCKDQGASGAVKVLFDRFA